MLWRRTGAGRGSSAANVDSPCSITTTVPTLQLGTAVTESRLCLIRSSRELSVSFRSSTTVAFGQHSRRELYAIGGVFVERPSWRIGAPSAFLKPRWLERR